MDFKYHEPNFEYEELFQNLEEAWAGHKHFAYDLVANLKPGVIVELGTYKGTSFFSFCQAVKDHNINTTLYAIDTWKGDRHVNYYGEEVWELFIKIKNSYYQNLDINIHKTTFDEAASEFEDNSIDILHIDGLHTYDAVKHDFETWKDKVKNNGIILFHDIHETKEDFGVHRLWEELKKEHNTIEFTHSHGLGVLFKGTVLYHELTRFQGIWQRYYPLNHCKKILKNFISTKDENINLLQEQIGRLNESIESLKNESNKELTELSSKLALSEQTKQNLENKVQELNNTISEIGSRFDSLEQENRQLHRHVSEHKQTISNIVSTRSWKFTHPLRIAASNAISFKQKIDSLYEDSRLGIELLSREGIEEFSRRLYWYLRGKRLPHEIPHDSILSNNSERNTRITYEEWIKRNDTLEDRDRSLIRSHIESFDAKPKFSVLMPVYNTHPQFLREAIDSVLLQLYENWELCIADDASTYTEVHKILREYEANDPRIKVSFRETNGGISACSNTALEMATGEWIALLDHDDKLSEHALYLVANEISSYPDSAIIYSDEDHIDKNGKRFNPYFKPDWDYDLFLGQNYISHLGVYILPPFKERP